MENVSHLFADTARVVNGGRAYRRSSRPDRSTERQVAKPSSAYDSEWTILRTFPVNALLIGAEHLTAAAIARLEKSFRQPQLTWVPTLAADVPEFAAGTLVIRGVDRLEASQQERLERWIDAHHGRVQLLSLARDPLFPQVLDGRFSAALYSRLNTVMVDLQAPADLP